MAIRGLCGIGLLVISFKVCFGCSKELSHGDGSFEHPKNVFWSSNREINLQLHTLIRRPVLHTQSVLIVRLSKIITT